MLCRSSDGTCEGKLLLLGRRGGLSSCSCVGAFTVTAALYVVGLSTPGVLPPLVLLALALLDEP